MESNLGFNLAILLDVTVLAHQESVFSAAKG